MDKCEVLIESCNHTAAVYVWQCFFKIVICLLLLLFMYLYCVVSTHTSWRCQTLDCGGIHPIGM